MIAFVLCTVHTIIQMPNQFFCKGVKKSSKVNSYVVLYLTGTHDEIHHVITNGDVVTPI